MTLLGHELGHSSIDSTSTLASSHTHVGVWDREVGGYVSIAVITGMHRGGYHNTKIINSIFYSELGFDKTCDDDTSIIT